MQRETNVHMRNLVAWAENRPEALVLSGDLTGSTEIKLFKETYPDRFFSLGMAEQNMMSFAGGLAREGYLPMVHTFAVFMYRRALDQIEMSIAYPNLRVWMFGFLPGISTPGGVSHQAINDIGVLRTVPNLTIYETGDATDMESALEIGDQVEGPVYFRMIRKEVPRLFAPSDRTRLGKLRRLSRGADVTLVSSGLCTEQAVRAVAALSSKGLRVDHFHATTLKPFRDTALVESASASRYGVVTIENHVVSGGLGTATAELLSEHGVGARHLRIGLQDTYSHGASQDYLMREHGIDAEGLVRGVEALTGERFDIDRADLAATRISIFAAEGQLEAL